MPGIYICHFARAATSILGQLHAPQDRMQCYQGPDEAACPTVQPHEFVKVHICEKGDGENGKGRALEGEEDAQWEESEGHKTCSTPRSPPGLLNCVLWYVWRNVGRRQAPEKLLVIRGSDVVRPYESGSQGGSYDGEEREHLRVRRQKKWLFVGFPILLSLSQSVLLSPGPTT